MVEIAELRLTAKGTSHEPHTSWKGIPVTKPARILVTGGAGFLGSHLCERLIQEGHDVICLDNFFTGTRANLAHLLANPHFELARHDVEHPLTIEVDQIFHLACPASPVHYQRNPVRTIRTAVQGTLNLLEVAREAGARILIASTSEVYGDPAEHPQRESYWGHVNPIGPRACYDEGKRCAETLATSYARQYGVEVRIARIFNTYGPRMHENDGRVVSNFVVQAGQPRQPARDVDAGAGDPGSRHGRLARRHSARALAQRRSGAAQPGHRAGAEAAGRLDAAGAAGTRAGGHHRVFPWAGRPVQRVARAVWGRPKAHRVAQDRRMSQGGRNRAPEPCAGAQEPRQD